MPGANLPTLDRTEKQHKLRLFETEDWDILSNSFRKLPPSLDKNSPIGLSKGVMGLDTVAIPPEHKTKADDAAWEIFNPHSESTSFSFPAFVLTAGRGERLLLLNSSSATALIVLTEEGTELLSCPYGIDETIVPASPQSPHSGSTAVSVIRPVVVTSRAVSKADRIRVGRCLIFALPPEPLSPRADEKLNPSQTVKGIARMSCTVAEIAALRSFSEPPDWMSERRGGSPRIFPLSLLSLEVELELVVVELCFLGDRGEATAVVASPARIVSGRNKSQCPANCFGNPFAMDCKSRSV